MYTKEYIESAIKDTVQKVTGKKELTKDTSLIDKDLGIVSVNFLYIFDILETMLGIPVCKVFENHSYDVMRIDNLTEAIYKMQGN